MKARALYDFEAEDEEEISFEAGDIVVVSMTDKDTQDGWWKGKRMNDSKEGYFPSTYVEEISEEEFEEAQKAEQENPEIRIEGHTEEPEAFELARRIEEVEFKRITLVVEEMKVSMGPDSNKLAELIKAKLDQQAAQWQTEEEEEWMKQHSKKPEASKPTSEQLSKPTASSSSTAGIAADISKIPELKGKSPEKWSAGDVSIWLSHIGFREFASVFEENEISGEALLELDHETFREMGIKSIGKRIKLLNKIIGLAEFQPEETKGIPLTFSAESLSRLSDSSDEQSGNEDKVRAIADFMSDKKEELTFSKGAVITILEKPSAEWWRGELNGKVGLFPRSHVVSVDDPEHQPGSLAERRKSQMLASQNVVLSGIDAVSPQGVKSTKNRKVSQKDIYASQRLSRKARPKVVAAPVPDITAADIGRPDFQGWLTKRGGNVKNWKRRWFVLKDYCLYYFKDPVDGFALGCITLPSYSIAPTKEFNKTFAFKAFHSGARTYYFYADSEGEMELWMKALAKAALGDVKKPNPQPAAQLSASPPSNPGTPKSIRKPAPAPPRKATSPTSPMSPSFFLPPSSTHPSSNPPPNSSLPPVPTSALPPLPGSATSDQLSTSPKSLVAGAIAAQSPLRRPPPSEVLPPIPQKH